MCTYPRLDIMLVSIGVSLARSWPHLQIKNSARCTRETMRWWCCQVQWWIMRHGVLQMRTQNCSELAQLVQPARLCQCALTPLLSFLGCTTVMMSCSWVCNNSKRGFYLEYCMCNIQLIFTIAYFLKLTWMKEIVNMWQETCEINLGVNNLKVNRNRPRTVSWHLRKF